MCYFVENVPGTGVLKYRITDIETIQRIAILLMNEGNYTVPFVETNQEFRKRESYLEGATVNEVDLSRYDKSTEDSNG